MIDEVSMCDRQIIEALDGTFRDIRDTDRLFDGIIMIFSGDWRQILPVIGRGDRAVTVAVILKQFTLWEQVQVHRLTKNMRMHNTGSGDDKFDEELL